MVRPATGEDLARLSPEERGWITRFHEELTARLGDRLRDLRIFGSKVRGDAHEESDIDLLVLIDGLDPHTWTFVVDLAHAISPWLAPVVEDFDAYHAPASRASGFYKELREESVRL